MNIKNKLTRLGLLFVATLLIVCQLGSFATVAEDISNEKTIVIAGSDFQASSLDTGALLINYFLGSMERNNGITSADGFLFCGDYATSTNNLADNKAGVNKLKSTLKDFVPEENMVFAQGNHDCAIGTAGMSPSGSNDPASNKYGVFVINEDDYMWYNDDEERIIKTSLALEKYLDEKAEEKFDAPIFVVSHLQLHVSMRTQKYGDGLYAGYIFDVLNKAGAQGLNIIFLFGHNHGDGWDDYLGGSSVYLPKGDEITIARGSMSGLTTETLSFYYMNAGYVGYYNKCNEGADAALTMTSFVFDDDTLEIARYTTNKFHNLKGKGVVNSYKNEGSYGLYSPNTAEYESPQIIKLNKFDDTSASPETESPEVESPDTSIPEETGKVEEANPESGNDSATSSVASLPKSIALIISALGISAVGISALAIVIISGIVIAVIITAAIIVAVIIIKKKKRK